MTAALSQTGRMEIATRAALLASLLSHATSFLMPLMSLLVVKQLAATPLQAAVIMGAAFLVTGLIQPYFGRLLDSNKTSMLFFLSLLGYAMGFGVVLAHVTSVLLLIVGLVLYVLALGATQTASSRLLEGTLTAIHNRSLMSILWAMVSNAGSAVASLIAYFMFEEYSQQLIIIDLVSSVAYLLTIIWAQRFTHVPVSRPLVAARSLWRTLYSAFTAKPKEFLACQMLLITLVMQFSTIPLLYVVKGMDALRFTTSMGALNALLVVIVGFLLTRNWLFNSFRGKLLAASLLTGIGLAFVPTIKTLTGNLIITTIWSIGEICIYPVVAVLIFSTFDSTEPGVAAGAKTLMFRIAFFLGPALTALMLLFPEPLYPVIFCVPSLAASLLTVKYLKGNG